MEPPESEPQAPAQRPAATATPEPLLDHPGARSRFQGIAGFFAESGGTGHRELAHGELSEENRPGGSEAGADGAVVFRYPVPVDTGTAGGGHPGGVEYILERDRNAVQRPAPLASTDLRFRAPRIFERPVARYVEVAVEPAVEALDALQVSAAELDRREIAVAKASPHLFDGEVAELRPRAHVPPPSPGPGRKAVPTSSPSRSRASSARSWGR